MFEMSFQFVFRKSSKRKRKRSKSVLWQNLYTHRKPQKAKWKYENATKHFDYTTIVDRLRTVTLSDDSQPIGVVKPVNGSQYLPLTTTVVYYRGHEHADTILQRKR